MDDHERAQAIAALPSSADPEEQELAQRHVAACPSCLTAVSDMERGRDGLRFVATPPEPVLVATTQRRVREHAMLLREEQVRRRGLVLSFVLAASLTLTTGLSLWRLSAWLTWAVTPWVWGPTLVGLWFLPGVLAGVVWVATERRSALTQ
jgi:hypothetical protein